MKKIMITIAVLAIAAIAQAATVTWGSGVLKDSTGVAYTANDKVTAYLWNITLNDYTTYSELDAATLSRTVAQAFVDGSLGNAEATKSNTYTSRGGASADLAGTTSFLAGNTAYGLILYVDADKQMYMANVASAEFVSAQNKTVSQLSILIGGSNGTVATSWQSIPEPTSGLLILLGMAGLALRRRCT